MTFFFFRSFKHKFKQRLKLKLKNIVVYHIDLVVQTEPNSLR